LLLEIVNRRAICFNSIRVGLETFDRPADSLGMADLLERSLLVSKLQATRIYLLLKIPARRRVQDTSHEKEMLE
jgi:hypothetical protein